MTSVFAIMGLAAAAGNRTLPDGRLVTCISESCSVPSKVDETFHWTPKLRASAKPMVPSKPRASVKPMAPNMSVSADRSASVAQTETDCPTPERITDFSPFPTKAIGRVNFQHQDGDGYICSGAFIAADVVLTAGHCCWEDGNWSKNFEIVLGYDHGGGTSYEADDLRISKGWQHDTDEAFKYDYCFLKMKSEGPAWLGWQTDVDFSQPQWDSIDAYGYPENYGDTEELYVAHSTYMRDSISLTDDKDAGYYRANCNPMHHGNSGGPWFANDLVVGLNSHHNGGDWDIVEYSPYLTRNWYEICQAAGGCKDYEVMKDGSFKGKPGFNPVTQIIV